MFVIQGVNIYKGIIFDMDGLLIDSERIVQRSWNIAGNELGFPKTGEHIYKTLGFNLEKRREYFKETLGETFPFEEFNILTRKNFKKITEKNGIPLRIGAIEIMEFVASKNLKIGLATSSRREYAERVLKENNLLKYIDVSIFGDMVKYSKPNPEIYLLAAKEMGLNPKECLAVEDSPSGVEAAINGNMHIAMIPDLVEPTREIEKKLDYKESSLLNLKKTLEIFLDEKL